MALGLTLEIIDDSVEGCLLHRSLSSPRWAGYWIGRKDLLVLVRAVVLVVLRDFPAPIFTCSVLLVQFLPSGIALSTIEEFVATLQSGFELSLGIEAHAGIEPIESVWASLVLDPQEAFEAANVRSTPLQAILNRLEEWTAQPNEIHHWISYRITRDKANDLGLTKLVDGLALRLAGLSGVRFTQLLAEIRAL